MAYEAIENDAPEGANLYEISRSAERFLMSLHPER